MNSDWSFEKLYEWLFEILTQTIAPAIAWAIAWASKQSIANKLFDLLINRSFVQNEHWLAINYNINDDVYHNW